jgi:hypothetical protein
LNKTERAGFTGFFLLSKQREGNKMPIIEPTDYHRKYPVSATAKFIVLLLILFGIWFRGCWYKQQANEILISNVQVSDITSQSVDVHFTIENRKPIDWDQNLFIKVYTSENQQIASKIVKVHILKKRSQDYVKVIDKFERALKPNETIQKATVELYQAKVFGT